MRWAILLAAAALCHAAEPAEGRWEGTLEIPGGGLAAVIDLAQSNGQWVGSATVPGFTKGSQLTDIVVKPPAVSFTLKGVMGEPSFAGSVTDGTFSGTVTQAGNRAAFRLRRTGEAQVDLPRLSTSVTRELEGEWQGEVVVNGNRLKATLKLTNQASGHAAAQFVVVGKRETNIPIDLVRQDGEFVAVSSSAYRISFEGRIRRETGELTGTFAQGPIETPLNLRKP